MHEGNRELGWALDDRGKPSSHEVGEFRFHLGEGDVLDGSPQVFVPVQPRSACRSEMQQPRSLISWEGMEVGKGRSCLLREFVVDIGRLCEAALDTQVGEERSILPVADVRRAGHVE